MKLPNLHVAVVPQEKICGYLLSSTHPAGRIKAAFFSQFGFAVSSWETLAAALTRHATDHGVVTTKESVFGVRYIVEGTMETPDGRNPTVRVVWFIARDQTVPRLVTAYPCGQRL